MFELWLGGPDRPPRLLRDLLQQRIEAVPKGGEIDWATYYFRDRAIAKALMAASDRGVAVTLHVEGAPRRKTANEVALSLLSSHGLRAGLHIHRPGKLLPKLHPHLHTKIYAFSGPEPAAFVGSFNPSGDEPEDPEVIAEIGDQDRGHNLLVGYHDPTIVSILCDHVRGMRSGMDRLRGRRTAVVDETSFFFYPRIRTSIAERQLASLGSGAHIRGAISHLKAGAFTEALTAAAARGAAVQLLVHDTERRVPAKVVERLSEQGISVSRYIHPEHLPLHAKFLLVEAAGARTAWFGSFNFNSRSRYLNHELLVRSRDEQLWAALSSRFDEIAAEAAAIGKPAQ